MILEALAVASFVGGVIRGVGEARASRAARREGAALSRDAIDRGEEEVRRFELQLAQLLGSQRTDIAAQGVDTTFGTAKTLRDEAIQFGLEDVATIRLNAQREARGYRARADQAADQFAASSAFTFLNAGVDAWSWYRQNQRMTAPAGAPASAAPGIGGPRGSTRTALPRATAAPLRLPARTGGGTTGLSRGGG